LSDDSKGQLDLRERLLW